MRRTIGIQLLCCGLFITVSICLAQDPLEKTKAIDEQIKLLDESAVAKEMRTLSERRDALYRLQQKESEKLSEESQKLQETEAWKMYVQKRTELMKQRENPRETELKAMAKAAKDLYAARHAELRSKAAGDLPGLKALGLDVLTYPCVDGSTSTQPLAVILASRALGVPYEWVYAEPRGYHIVRAPHVDGMTISGSAMMMPWGYSEESHELSLVAARVYAKPPADRPEQLRLAQMINSLLASNHGTHESYVSLIQGQTDIALVARAPSADEVQAAKEKGIVIEAKPIALDALVFIVNHKNPLDNMTLDEIRALYREALADKPRRFDESKKLFPLMRDRNSGSRELFDALVMKGEAVPDPKSARMREMYTGSMSGPYNRVTTEPNALGYSVYYYERFMAMSAYTRTISIDGVPATPETIASGKYPLTSPVYAAYRANTPPDAPAMKLFNWLVSPEGQTVIRESGYVPALNPKP
jgi:phosphate transport system substrate-binding protein